MFAMCMCLLSLRWMFVICSSVFVQLMLLGMEVSVKVMLCLMRVTRPPPCLCDLSFLSVV